MKKINFEKLSNKELFSSFEQNKLTSITSSSLKGASGTSTALCKTIEENNDRDSAGGQENLKDSRCTGY